MWRSLRTCLPNLVPAADAPDKIQIPLDPKNWEIITDAMANVTSPHVVDATGAIWTGTAAAAHLQGIDFAGKTGTAQTISGSAKAKIANGKARFKNNAWFVGVSPRRNPEIVVAVLWEGGEEGPLAAIVASQVIKAYVEKQRRSPTKMADQPKGDGKVEIGAVWTAPDADGDAEKLQGGRFVVDVPKKAAGEAAGRGDGGAGDALSPRREADASSCSAVTVSCKGSFDSACWSALRTSTLRSGCMF